MSDPPEEPGEGEPGPDDGVGGEDVDPSDARLRGWIDPDDRLWRHPSEVAGAGPGGSGGTRGSSSPGAATGEGDPGPPLLLNAPPSHRWRNALMVLIGALAVMAVVAFLIVLLSPASDHPQNTNTTDTAADAPVSTLPGTQNAVPAVAVAAGHSIVELRAITAHGTTTLIGVAVAEGGLVVTTADVLNGLRRLDVVGPDGHLETASLVGTDVNSDIALVDVPEDVPVAPFSDDSGVGASTPDLTLTLVADSDSGALALHCTSGSVTSVGNAVTNGPANGMPTIVSATPGTGTNTSTTPPPGSPLLNAAGDVLGILYAPSPAPPASGATVAPSTTAATTPLGVTFLPTNLVVGVADDLRSGNKVVHGWLGVSGTNEPNGAGARVATVDPGGPAASRLQPGMDIVAVNGQPVRTMAELRARLYVMAPGTAVAISLQGANGSGGSGTKVVDLTLGSSS